MITFMPSIVNTQIDKMYSVTNNCMVLQKNGLCFVK